MTDQTERENLDRDTSIFLGAHSARAGNDSGMIEAVSLLHRWQTRAALDGGTVSPTDDEIEQWAEGFIRQQSYNRPVAIQIAMEAAKFVRSRTSPQRDGGAVSQQRSRLLLDQAIELLDQSLETGLWAEQENADIASRFVDHVKAFLRAPQQLANIRCEACKGTGKTQHISYKSADATIERSCSVCKGTGLLGEEQPSSERDLALIRAGAAYVGHQLTDAQCQRVLTQQPGHGRIPIPSHLASRQEKNDD